MELKVGQFSPIPYSFWAAEFWTQPVQQKTRVVSPRLVFSAIIILQWSTILRLCYGYYLSSCFLLHYHLMWYSRLSIESCLPNWGLAWPQRFWFHPRLFAYIRQFLQEWKIHTNTFYTLNISSPSPYVFQQCFSVYCFSSSERVLRTEIRFNPSLSVVRT